VHQNQVGDAAGNRLRTAIVIDIAPDNTTTRTDFQRLDRVNGDFQEATVRTGYDAQDTRLGEQTLIREKTTENGTVNETTQRITGQFSNEVLVRQHMDMDVKESSGAKPGETATATTKITADWFEQGRPITNASIPVITRETDVRYFDPSGGLHKGFPRVVTTQQVARGPVNALKHEDMDLTVRFEGKKGMYVERKLQVPVDAQGQPDMSKAKEISNVDKQASVDKALMKARIYGGFGSNIAIIIGSRLLGASPGLGKGLVVAGLASGSAELAGESHALATGRNDASVGRLGMSVYDTTWNALYGMLILGRGNGRLSVAGAGNATAGLQSLGTRVGVASVGGRLALEQTTPWEDSTLGWSNLRGEFGAVANAPTRPLAALSGDLAAVRERTKQLGGAPQLQLPNPGGGLVIPGANWSGTGG